jgi:hypothetical protein
MRRLSLIIFAAACVAASPVGDLWQPAYCLDFELRGPTTPYEPQVGDIVFYCYEGDLLWELGYKVALAGRPDHSGIVVKMPDGTLATLEAGPDDSLSVEVCSLAERLKFHHCNRGRVWIRRRKHPLTEEQSCLLTKFAISERGKNFTLWRLGAQITPFRSRGPLRTFVMGKPQGPHFSYFCSEVVLEAAVYAGIMDRETTRPRATYPEDFFFDRSRNYYLDGRFSLACDWEPPARLTFEDCPCCKAQKGGLFWPNREGIPVHPWIRSNGAPKPTSLRNYLNP